VSLALGTKLKELRILSGTAVSNVIRAREQYEDASIIALFGDDVTDGVITYTLEVTNDAEPAAPTFYTLQIGDPAADAVPPLQDKAKVFVELCAVAGFRIKASANVTADRFWQATKQYLAMQY